jgi:phosphoribosyl 1,2-cyclic phosphodiesterase
MMNRRDFLKVAAASGLSTAARGFATVAPYALGPWTPGTLDIHHLAYGRGNSTFIMGPDGTTMLIDAGTTEDSLSLSCPQRPNANVRPGEWIASYILRQMKAAGRSDLDYGLITHLHPDHLGDIGPENPQSTQGNYRLTGISDVDTRVPIKLLIDRAYPNYDYPVVPELPSALNYL